jgi:uncharacterized protein
MKPFSLLIKPTSADCNLCCPYCFYLDKSALYPESTRHRMSDKVLERMISSYMSTDQPKYTFGWQGGEPALMGIEFFRKATSLQEKYGRDGSVVSNGMQTNATIIDDEFAAHLAKYKFLVGVSLDGHVKIHDHYRVRVNGSGTHADVLEGIDCLKRNNVEFNTLTLVTNVNVKKGKELYRYLCEKGFFYHQYIPCVEFDNKMQPMPFTVTAKEWGEFLCEIFDEWLKTDTRKVSVRLFDSILTLMLDGTPNICHMGRECCGYFVVEYNGDIYPCDFFVESGRKLGNIMNNSWEELQKSSEYLAFGRQKSMWNKQCSRCEYLKYCSGDCLKYRLYENNNPKKLNWLCEGWKQFYKHSLPAFKMLARNVSSNMKLSRNTPCPCGSGKKYKHCCGSQN